MEFKARTTRLLEQEALILAEPGVRFVGEDHQIDTYFQVPHGRLKLREGNIEHALIHYRREQSASAKLSEVLLYNHAPDPSLKAILEQALGVKQVVDKRRRIYFVNNVKFHFDRLDGLGEFVEVEAIDATGQIGRSTLQQQCDHYAALLGIQPQDYVAESYSDMVPSVNSKPLLP